MNTVRQYLAETLAGFDPTLDLSPNSTLNDLLLQPATAMMNPIIAQINYLYKNLGLLDPTTIPDAEMDAIASNFLKFRSQGSNSTGSVELFYNAPIDLDIPRGTQFSTSDGKIFVTTSQSYISKATMSNNVWNYPYYSTGLLPVVSQSIGATSAIDVNVITSTTLTPKPSIVTNPAAFTGGSDKETNVAFLQRILYEVIGGALGSAHSIKVALQTLYPTISSVTVVGMNSNDMLRDIVHSGLTAYSDRNVADFYGKVSGMNEYPYPESRAYWTIFYDNPYTSGIIPDLPAVDQFYKELSNTQYGGIFKLNDAQQTTIQTLTEFFDDFQGSSIDTSVWTMSDSIAGVGKVQNPDEINIVSRGGQRRSLRLGHRITNQDYSNNPVTVPGQVFYEMIRSMLHFVGYPQSVVDGLYPPTDLEGMIAMAEVITE